MSAFDISGFDIFSFDIFWAKRKFAAPRRPTEDSAAAL
jgi:hypothetical protein